MTREIRHLSVRIERPAGTVYDFCADPANLPRWAAGLAGGIRHDGGRWIVDSPMGEVEVRFAERNEWGVLDHDVVLPDGTTVRNPLRVLADGPNATDVVFTLRRPDDMDAAAFEADARAVTADLATLKAVLEAEEAGGGTRPHPGS